MPRLRRREVLGGGFVGAAAMAAPPAEARRSGARATFVLVHGAWHGGWCWRRVAERLEQEGARVLAPTLTGLGERSHLLSANVSLETHIQDVVAVIEAEELRDVHLVGHSYAGMVVTGVCDRLKDRMASVTYLDAAVPADGQSMTTQQPGLSPEAAAATEAALRSLAPDGVAMAVPPDVSIFGVPAGSDDAAWLQRRLTPHPLRTWLEPIRLAQGGSQGLPRSYLHCVRPALTPSSFPAHHARLSRDPSWTVATLETGHDAMITAPDAVAERLMQPV